MRFIYVILLFFSAGSHFGCAQNLPNNIDISVSPNGVIPLPSNVPTAYSNAGMVKYTKIATPNGQAIHFVAQDQLTDAQIVRARNILEFYLTNIPNTVYGMDKSVVMNQMGENNALLLLLNGADGQGNEPNLPGQYLFEDEIAVEGHDWYINNNYDHRDAAFEEILHLMHDTGFGVDGPNSFPGALPDYQMEIRAAQENANANNFSIWPIGAGGANPDVQNWFDELSDENSLSQEYLASVIDVYYGLWGAWTDAPGGMWGIYVAKTRDEIETLDPMGWNLLPKYFSPMININMDIDPSFNGSFVMFFDDSHPYTHKSQYLQHCTLTGTNSSNLIGNDEYNRLVGNDANNSLEGGKGNDKLDGAGGNDIAKFTGNYNEYTIQSDGVMTIVRDNILERDGTDTLWNIEVMEYADQNIDIITSTKNIQPDYSFEVYPNPTSDYLTIEWNSSNKINKGTLQLFDSSGKLGLEKTFSNSPEKVLLNIQSLEKGVYTLQIKDEKKLITKKVIIK